MMKKVGLVTVGVSAALVAASPMAFAGNSSYDNGGDHGHGDKGHSRHHGHGDKDRHGSNNTSCKSESGAVKHNDTEGILALGPILDGNSGQIASCNSFLNDNFSGNHVSALNGLDLGL